MSESAELVEGCVSRVEEETMDGGRWRACLHCGQGRHFPETIGRGLGNRETAEGQQAQPR